MRRKSCAIERGANDVRVTAERNPLGLAVAGLAAGFVVGTLLPQTRLVIVHSSAAAITALLEGVPAISTSLTAAAFDVGEAFTRQSVESPSIAPVEARLHFAQQLADHQITLEEFRSGYAWEVLNR